MDARAFDKSRLPSRHVTEGRSRAPYRSYCYAMGLIAIDAAKGTLEIELRVAELEKRRRAWKAPANPYQSGVLRTYADQVGPARKGAATHAGGRAEVVCYADI